MSKKFKTIQEYLTVLNIASKSKHAEFNISKLEDESDETLNKLGPYQNDFFEIVFSKNDIAEVVIGKTNFNLIPIIFGSVFLIIFLIVGYTNKQKRVHA